MPIAYVRSFLHAMDELDAEEQLVGITAAAMQNGVLMDKDDRDRVISNLRSLAYGEAVQTSKRIATARTLAEVGIKVKRK